MNEREMTQFVYAFLSIDAFSLGERPGFAVELVDALKTMNPQHQDSLTHAEEVRLNKALFNAFARLEQMAGEMLDIFHGGPEGWKGGAVYSRRDQA